MNDTDLAALAAAIDSGDIETQCSVIPEGAPGRSRSVLAVRAAQRARECTADAIGLASEGRFGEAIQTINEGARHLETMQQQLFRAAQEAER